jgi:ATP-dependent RNA helicase DDX10/DBP4
LRAEKCDVKIDSKESDISENEKKSNNSKACVEDNIGPLFIEKNVNINLNPILEDSSDDEDQDILKIKRKDHEIPETEDDDDIKKEEKQKIKVTQALTKAAVAKRVLKKGIKPNLVTQFDEEGDAIESVNSQKISEEGRKYDEKVDVVSAKGGSGINIEEAARVLKAEDRYDQQIEREKVRLRKKAEKRKAKETKRKKLEQSEDENMEDISEDGTDDGPDLDWLPDPDKVYGIKKPIQIRAIVGSIFRYILHIFVFRLLQLFTLSLFGFPLFCLFTKSNLFSLYLLIVSIFGL